MNIFIYSFSKLTTPRDVVEEMLEQVLGEEGEVTGGGGGTTGSNIDIEVYHKDAREFLGPIRKVLKDAQLPPDSIIVIEGEQFKVYEQ
jgi:hypothetical protein